MIKTTLIFLQRITGSAQLRSRLKTICAAFADVDVSLNIDADFAGCEKGRNLKSYELALSWCNVFLRKQSFTSYEGPNVAYAILYPMEELFEEYIAELMKRIVAGDSSGHYYVKTQERSKRLFEGYLLKPDIVIHGNDETTWIMDTKWKIPYEGKPDQGDLYQMYTYQHKYGGRIPGNGDGNMHCQNVTLLYPADRKKEAVFPKSTPGIFYDENDDSVLFYMQYVDLSTEEDTINSLEKIWEKAYNNQTT